MYLVESQVVVSVACLMQHLKEVQQLDTKLIDVQGTQLLAILVVEKLSHRYTLHLNDVEERPIAVLEIDLAARFQ